MAAPVTVRFVVEGLDQVQSAFRKVEDAVVRGDRASSDSSARTSRARISDAEREARAKQQILDREAREKIAAMKTADKAIADAMKTATRETEKAAKDAVRLEQTAAREKARIAEAATREKSRQFAQLARESEKWAQDEIRTAKRAEDEKTRIAENAARARQRFASTISGAAISGARAGLSRVGGVTSGIAGTALSLGGGFTIADSMQSTMGLQRSIAMLANSADGVNGVSAKDLDQKSMMARAKAASIASGTDAGELVDATRSYVAKSSDFKGGMENMEFFGKLAKGTGSDVKDVARAAGIIRSQNKDLDAEGAKKMLLSVVMQGKQGAVEIDQLALNAGKITRGSTSYAGDQAENQQKLLGLAQIAVRTAGSPAAAATSLSALGSDTRNHSAALKQLLGHDVLDKNGKINMGPEELLAEVFGATGGNLQKLGQGKGNLGFTKPTMKLFEALSPEFTKAQEAYLKEHPGDQKGANAAGAKASLAEMKGLTGQTMSSAGLDTMVKRVLDTPAEQFEAAIRQLKMEVGEQLLPEFQKLIPVVKDMIPLFVDVAKTSLPAFLDLVKSLAEFATANRGIIHDIAAHPIGALIAKELMTSIASAGLGEAMKTSIGQSLGAAGIVIGTAYLTIKKLADDDQAVVTSGNAALTGSANARGDLRAGVEGGTIDRATIEEAKKKASALTKSIGEQEGNKGGGSAFYATALASGFLQDVATLGAAGGVTGAVGSRKERTAVDEKQIAEQKAELTKLTLAITNAEKAMNKLATSAKAADPSRSQPQGSAARGGAQ